MRQVDLIVVHCSATPNGRRTTIEDVDRWHADAGYKRQQEWRKKMNPALFSVGYHFLIRVNGALDTGRHLDEPGAHVRGYNATSVGICMVGMDSFAAIQWAALRANVTALLKQYPKARVCGHRDLNAGKTCPGFDVAAWLKADMQPTAAHILAPSKP